MAAAVVRFYTYVAGQHVQDSNLLEPLFKTISVTSDGSDHGTTISESGGKFSFNSKKLAGVAAGAASGEVITFELIGAANGIAPLDGSSKVPAVNLPSYVDDVLEFADLAAFPGTGETGKIYVALDTSKCYRWSGSIYVEVSPSEVNSVNGQTGIVVLTTANVAEVTNLYYTQARFDAAFAAKSTTDLAEGSNLYFTTARAKTAAVVNSLGGSQTDQAPSVSAVNAALALLASPYESMINDEASTISALSFVYQDAFGGVKLIDPAAVDITEDSLFLSVKDATIATTASGQFYDFGALISGFPGASFTVGQAIYPSKTVPGGFQADLTGYVAGDKVIKLGIARTATSMKFRPQFLYVIG